MIQKIINTLIVETERSIIYNNIPSNLKCVFINTDTANNEATLHIENTRKTLEKFGISSEVIIQKPYDTGKKTHFQLLKIIERLNRDKSIHGIILSLPVHKNLKKYQKNLANAISETKDIDGLSQSNPMLPITAQVLFDIISKWVEEVDIKQPRIYLRGMGATTNAPLMIKLLETFGHIRICNSKTFRIEDRINMDWADIIISSTGIPESVVDVKGKVFISPTIIRSEDGKMVNDLMRDFVGENDTHKVTGTIGKLTRLYLIKRFLPSY